MAMRPHDLNVVNDHTVTTGRNVFTATVGVVEYQGREFAVEVTTSTGQRLFVHAETAPQVGDEVTLVLDPARALVYQQNLDAGVSEEEREHQELAEVGS
jgi:putative spermidine/putrescine transport system ATP-binding protein